MSLQQPPNWILKFLCWFCPDHLLEEIEGDLFQKFEKDVEKLGLKKAKRKFTWNVIRYLRSGIVMRNSFSLRLNSMFASNLRFTLRILSRNKIFTFINVFGLTISIAAVILNMDYAAFEKSYDKFFRRHENIFRLQHNRYVDGDLLYKKAMTFPEIGLALKNYFPEIEEVGRLFPAGMNIEPVFTSQTESGEEKSFSEPNTYLADSTFIKIFDLDFIHGNSNSALSGIDKVIISKSTSLRYFGKTDVIGEKLRGNIKDVEITGVFEDLPENSHLKFDILWSWFDVYGERSRFTWDGFYTYILIRDKSNPENIRQKLSEFAIYYMGPFYADQPGSYSQFEIQPLADIHLKSHLEGELKPNGNLTVVNILIFFSWLILLIAIINHVNLNTSKSLDRLREVGIRKTIGSSKFQLTIQFLIESFIINLLAVTFALSLSWTVYPTINEIFNTKITLELISQPFFWICIIGFTIIASIISGFYPAFILTRHKIHHALKGLSVGGKKSNFQKSLVAVQFSISLLLIIASYVTVEQVRYMQNKDLGFGSQNKIVVKILPSHGDESDTIFVNNISQIKNELSAYPFINKSTVSSSIPGRQNEWRGRTRLAGENNLSISANLTRIDEDFIDAFELNLLAGRNYTSSLNNENSIVINAEAAKQLGFPKPKEALGEKIMMFREREIIGIVQSFHEAGLQESISPSLFITGEGYTKFLTIGVAAGSLSDQIKTIEQIWKKHFPNKPFQYFFLSDYFNGQYQADTQISKNISIFSSLAIIVASLGLIALASYTIHRKTKEIGIRKIHGASKAQIAFALNLNFMIPIFVAAVVGIPFGIYFAKWWLERYAYRIDLSINLFLVPLSILFAISLLTILFQSINAASKNPIDSLRYE